MDSYLKNILNYNCLPLIIILKEDNCDKALILTYIDIDLDKAQAQHFDKVSHLYLPNKIKLYILRLFFENLVLR